MSSYEGNGKPIGKTTSSKGRENVKIITNASKSRHIQIHQTPFYIDQQHDEPLALSV
mgnify:CR=1 FL=1